MISANLALLKELTHQLTLEDFVRAEAHGWVRYETIRGSCIGVSLLHERAVAIQKSFMSKDTIFPKHIHDEVEILVVFEGKLQCSENILSPGDLVRFAPGDEHEIVALEDTWMVGITIPASPAYPDARSDAG